MRIKVPATSANLGPGFDTLGMALQFYNHFEAHPSHGLTLRLSPSTCVDVAGLSLDPAESLLVKAYKAYYEYRDEPVMEADLVIEAHIPLSRGLGSSSTAVVAGLYLADCLHPEPLGKAALVSLASQLEGHPDNVVPAMLGGVRCCLSDGTDMTLAWPESWGILLVIPPSPLSTHQARSVMPTAYSQTEAVENIRGMAAWIYGLMKQDQSLFRYALASDTLHEPSRGRLIPEYPVLQEAVSQVDTLGSVISGSGSAMAVYTADDVSHKAVKEHLSRCEALSHCKIMSVKPDGEGARVQ